MSENFYIPQEWSQWSVNKVIGRTQTGSVALAQKTDGQNVDFAYIKQIDTGTSGYNSKTAELQQEAQLLKELNGGSIAGCEDYFFDYEGRFFVRMECVECICEIMHRYGRLSEIEVIKLGIDLCSALEVLQSRNIVHGKINPGYIFYAPNGTYKLGGIGSLGQLDTLLGGNGEEWDNYFSAPEIISGMKPDILTDIYSVGCVMYYLLNNNKPPFMDQSFSQISYLDKTEHLNRKMSGEAFPAPVNCVNRYLRNIISTACEFDPDKRWKNPTALKKALENILKDEIAAQAERESEEQTAKTGQNSQYSGAYKQQMLSSVTEQTARQSVAGAQSNQQTGSQSGGYQNYSYRMDTEGRTAGEAQPNKKKNKAAVLVGSIAGAAAAVLIAVLLFVYPGFLLEGGGGYADNSNSATEKNYGSASDKNKESTTEKKTEAEKISVPKVTGQKEKDAEELLEDKGFDVDIVYEYSDDVSEGRVISQSVSYGTKLEEGSTVTIVVSKGEELKPSPEDYGQKIVVETSGTFATMELFEWNGKYWESKFYTSNVRIGSNGAGYDYGEGKKITPKGTFDIGFCFGIYKPDTGLEFKKVTSSSVFVDDPGSIYYNMLVDRNALSGNVSYENTYDQFTSRDLYNTCIFIEHNGDGETTGSATPYKGSVITICGKKGELTSTFGCIDISAEDMNVLLKYLDADEDPVIIIK